MILHVAWVGRTKEQSIQALTDEYLKRLGRYTSVQHHEFASEAALLKFVDKAAGRTAPVFILLDQRGPQFTSESFAEFVRELRDRDTQNVLFAIGPADGFTEAALHAANQRMSLGKMTLPHELARVVLLEQLYRAFTIVHGHPYHTGH